MTEQQNPAAEAWAKTSLSQLSSDEPLRIARAFLNQYRPRRLLFHQGAFYCRLDSSYAEESETTLRAEVYGFLDGAGLKPNKRKVSDVIDALRAQINIPERLSPPCFLESGAPASSLIVFQNGVIDTSSDQQELRPYPDDLFTVGLCDYKFDPKAPAPTRWIDFLNSLWEDDPDSINVLQEWFGLMLTTETRWQAILLIVGPKRSGKSTIARVLRGVVGASRVAAPTLGGLATPFGLAGLIGKAVAIFGDMRLGKFSDEQIIAEKILSISGEDVISVSRKFLPDWIGQLIARVMMLCNELPRIGDASGALASRLIVLILKKSFFGQEDRQLTDALLDERPAIARWALEGLRRLKAAGRFYQPESGRDAIETVGELGSPVMAFVNDECELKPGAEVRVHEIYDRWKQWCEDQGRRRPSPINIFGRDIRAALPSVMVVQAREGGSRFRVYQGLALRDSHSNESVPLRANNQGHGVERIKPDRTNRGRDKNNNDDDHKECVPMSDTVQAALVAACAGLGITPDQLAARLSADDLRDTESGKMTPADLRVWAEYFNGKDTS